MAGDPTTEIFWYEAADKTIIPRYWQVFSCLHPLLIIALAPTLIVPEYFIARLIANMAGHRLLKPPIFVSTL